MKCWKRIASCTATSRLKTKNIILLSSSQKKFTKMTVPWQRFQTCCSDTSPVRERVRIPSGSPPSWIGHHFGIWLPISLPAHFQLHRPVGSCEIYTLNERNSCAAWLNLAHCAPLYRIGHAVHYYIEFSVFRLNGHMLVYSMPTDTSEYISLRD